MPMSSNDTNGWNTYEKLVMSELSDLKRDVESLHEELILMRIDIAMLKVKAGAWGALAGAIPAIAAYIAATSGVF